MEYYSYEELVNSWGYEVLEIKEFGSYQGDYAVLLKNGSQFGWVTISYGSCSYCDMLQGIESRSEYEEFSEKVKNEIRWNSATGLANWLSDKYLQEGKHTWYEEGYQEFLTATVEKLRSL